MEGYYQTTTGNPGTRGIKKKEPAGMWTHNTTQPLEIATVDGLKEYDGYTIEVND